MTVLSALHTVSAASLRDLDERLDEDVLVCGDRRPTSAAWPRSSTRSTGCAAWTAGAWRWPASSSRTTALMISVNARYKTHAGIKLTGLPAELWPAA